MSPPPADPPPAAPLGIERFLTRSTSFSYNGHTAEIGLSQSLFSSHEVDHGTRLLLKTIAARLSPRRGQRSMIRSVLDVGSGTGVLAVCLGLDNPGCHLVCQDRDALAVAFTRHNCAANGLGQVEVMGELALAGLGARRFDLVVSNLPAKAGEGAHRAFLQGCAQFVAPEGMLCLVTVRALEARILGLLESPPWRLAHQEATASHAVFHARPLQPATAGEPTGPLPDTPVTAAHLEPYLRSRREFRHGSLHYHADTVYDVSEFDTLSFATRLALQLLDTPEGRQAATGRVLSWNPGQGHLPLYLTLTAGGSLGGLEIGGRDRLQLEVTRHNLERYGRVPVCTHSHDPADVPGPFALMAVFPDQEPHVRWDRYLPALADRQLEPGGLLLVASGSTFVHRLLQASGAMALVHSLKDRGCRGVLLRKR